MTYSIIPTGTAYKTVTANWVWLEGWKRVLGRWVHDGTAWKQYFVAGAVQLIPATVRSFEYDPDIPISRLEFQTDGKIMASYTNLTVATSQNVADWYDPEAVGVGGGFEVMAKRISGAAADQVLGTALDTWLALSTAREWRVEGVVGSLINRVKSVTLEVAIRAVGQTEPLATAQYTLSTTTYSGSNPNGTYGKGGGIDAVAPWRFIQAL